MFSIIVLVTQIYKTKNITIPSYYCIFPVPGRNRKNKIKQYEIEVKIIIKIKRHNLSSNWQIDFMSNSDK